MFEDRSPPRLFGIPPGVDFPKAVVEGLKRRLSGCPPTDIARVELYVNTRRMQRRMRDIFLEGPATLLPRIRLITDLSKDPATAPLDPGVSPLRRKLELTQLIGKLLDKEPELAPRAALYDLADSLSGLLDEMQGRCDAGNIAKSGCV